MAPGTWPRARPLGGDQIDTESIERPHSPVIPQAVEFLVIACDCAFQGDLGGSFGVSFPEKQIQACYQLV